MKFFHLGRGIHLHWTLHNTTEWDTDTGVRLGESRIKSLERQVCAELAANQELVIATGGGMLVDESNRALMLESGFVICLDAAPEAIEARLRNADNRPLARDWRTLLEKRKSAYAAIPIHVDTTEKTTNEVAQEIIALWQSA